MFGRKSRKTIQVTKLSSLVADNLSIVGDVNFTGGLRIDGRVEGNVVSEAGEQSLVVLSEKGHVVGRVRAYDAVVNGTVEGDLEVEHFLELQPGARITGNIRYRQLQMDCGATVEGQLVRVRDEEEVKSLPAPKTESQAPLQQRALSAVSANGAPERPPAASRPEQPATTTARPGNPGAAAERRAVSAPSRPVSGSGVRRAQPAPNPENGVAREAARPAAAAPSAETSPAAAGVTRSG